MSIDMISLIFCLSMANSFESFLALVIGQEKKRLSARICWLAEIYCITHARSLCYVSGIKTGVNMQYKRSSKWTRCMNASPAPELLILSAIIFKTEKFKKEAA